MPSRARDIEPIVKRIHRLLAGRPPDIQGAVLADLLAIWLAGHRLEGMPEETKALRENLLQMHMGMVRELIAPNAEAIHGDADEQ